MTTSEITQFIEREKELAPHVARLVGDLEDLAVTLHGITGLSDETRFAAFEQGISVIGAKVGAWFVVQGHPTHLMIDTPNLGCVWIIYGQG